MSNFICSECGMTNIDCGRAGYKTSKEIELEKKLAIAINALKEYANEENWNNCGTEKGWILWFPTMFGEDLFGFTKAKNALKEIEEIK